MSRHPVFNFGLRQAVDIRDHAFRVAAHRDQFPFPKTSGTKHHFTGKDLPLDQGQTPRCVGYGTATLISAGPVRHAGLTRDKAQILAEQIYARALQIDEWEGEEDAGTSLHAGLKAATEFGYFGAFLWAQNVKEAALYVLNYGPVLFATPWPDSMMATDADGVLWAAADSPLEGPHAAGHCYCGAGVNTTKKFKDGTAGGFRISQTWGTGWGDKGEGMAWLPFSQADKLFMARGQIALPTEKRVEAAT